MSSGLVELAEGVLVIPRVAGPRVPQSSSLLGIDRIVMHPLELFSLVMDVLVVTRVLLSRLLVYVF